MTAMAKTKRINNKTGVSQENFTNATKVRQCNFNDFNKTGLLGAFKDLTNPVNNFYCPDSYENFTLAI